MKQYLLGLLLITASIAQAQNNKEPYLTQSLVKESIKNVEVQTSGGSISVTGVAPSEAKIEVYIQGNNNSSLSNEEIKKRLEEDYELTISVSNDKVTARARPKERNMNWKRGLNISFKVYVSKNVSTDLTTSGGSIHLQSIAGSQEFNTSGGSLHLEDVKGKVNGRTSGGSIHAEACSGDIDLATSGGSLHLEKLDGMIRASTSGGSINGKSIEGEFISHTSGGSISLSDLSCSFETSTSGGHIDVSVKEYGKYVKINNSGGNVDLRLPKGKGLDLRLAGNRVSTGELSNFNGHIEKDEVRGTMNGGGIPVTVQAGGGRVDLSWN